MICKKCKIEKENTEFPFKNKEKGILNCVCKVCQREYKIVHYHNNKQAHHDRNKLQKEKLRKFVSEAKSIGCLICKEKESVCLDFHHVDPSTKDLEIAKLIHKGSLKRLMAEIEKCIVLCSNCHRKVHAKIIEL